MLKPNIEDLLAYAGQPSQEREAKSKVVSHTAGGHSSLFKGRGLDFSEFREYVHGDDIRSIDWRGTARRGRPHTKVFIEERERSVYIIIDINSYMEFGTRQTFKSIQAARAAALIAWNAHSIKDKIGAILFGRHPEGVKFLIARSSRKSIWEMFRLLCSESAPHQEVKVEEALERARRRVPTGSSIFIISDFFRISDGFEKSLGILSKKCDITLIKVNDPADKSLPDVDRIKFSSENGLIAEIDTSDPQGEQRYRQLWIQSDTQLKEIASKLRAKLIRITTNGNVTSELFCKENSAERRV
jgi:uncharacterized protein (DUF58 family)